MKNRGGNGFLGIGLLGVWLGRLDPVRRFCQGKAKSNRSTHGRLPFPSHISDEGCRAFAADSSSFSSGSTQDESILVQQQRTCCSEWKKQHYSSQSDSSHVLLYRLQQSNSAQTCPASATTNHESHPASGAVIHTISPSVVSIFQWHFTLCACDSRQRRRLTLWFDSSDEWLSLRPVMPYWWRRSRKGRVILLGEEPRIRFSVDWRNQKQLSGADVQPVS
jgi:hypothetical protein